MTSFRWALSVPVLIMLGLCVTTQSPLAAQSAVCAAAAELVNATEPADSPRPDESAELLALWYADGLIADGALYDRIRLDLAQAAHHFPDLDLWRVERRQHPGLGPSVTFVDVAAKEHAQQGLNEGFNCLIDLLEARDVFFGPLRSVYVRFDSYYEPAQTSSLFGEVEDVLAAGPNFFSGVVDTGCFHSPDGVSRVYFLEEQVLRFPLSPPRLGNVERVELGPGGISVEEFDQRLDAPWRAELEACLERQLSGELDLVLQTTEIPTLSDISLLALVLALMGAGVVWSRTYQ